MSRTTSRRAILRALAAAPVAPAIAALPAGASEPHPDAALFAMVARFVEACRLADEASDALAAVEAACDASVPPRPDAMRRAGDVRVFPLASRDPALPEHYTFEECYNLRTKYLSPVHEPRFPHATGWFAAKRRAAEIVAAYDAWEAATDASEAALGLPEAEERDLAAFNLLNRTRAEIHDTRPTTLAGFAAKARAWCLDRGPDSFAEAIRADLLAIGGET